MSRTTVYKDNKNQLDIEGLYCIGGYITYKVFIVSAEYSGSCNFCICEKDINIIIEKINKMLETLSGEIQIFDSESDAVLELLFVNDMKFFVKGQIGGSYEDNILKFKFRADQTVLSGIREALLDY